MVRAGTVVMLIESMKMHHEVVSPIDARVVDVLVEVGAAVSSGEVLLSLEPTDDLTRPSRTNLVHSGQTRPHQVRRQRLLVGRARRSRRGRRASPRRVRRATAGRRGEAACTRSPHGAGEPGRPGRHRHLRRVRPARHRRPAPPARPRRSGRQHPGRRPRRRDRRGEPPAVRRRQDSHVQGGRRVVRLHGARRHTGHPEPPQEGPPVRGRRTTPAPDRVLHRGRWWSSRRHRRPWRERPRLSGVPLVRGVVGNRAARRHQCRLLLRGQRGDPRVLRCRDRHGGFEHRDGRSGDDRGWRARRVRADRDRADRGPTIERCRRHRRGRRSGSCRRREAVPLLFPGADRWLDRTDGGGGP